jgi:putative ABC transport system permease protein
MDKLFNDIRFALRILRRSPGITIVAVIALALGIGASTSIFSVVNAVLVRPLPFPESDRLVRVWATRAHRGEMRLPTSPADFLDWREQNQSISRIAARDFVQHNLTSDELSEQVETALISADMIGLLGVEPMLGRGFTADDDAAGHNNVILLSYGFWQRHFGGDPAAVGKTMTLSGRSCAIIGVMPRGYDFTSDAEIAQPIAFTPEAIKARGSRSLEVIARLKPGVSISQARSDLGAVAARLEQAYPDSDSGFGVNISSLYEETVGEVRPALLVVLGAVGCVLLIACTNVANLLLARAAGRRKEMALRAALGATRRRMLRQLLTESLLLSVAGGILGLLIAWWGVDVLVSLSPSDMPRISEVRLDAYVLGFTVLVSLATGIMFGSFPAIQASTPDLSTSLKEGSRGSTEGLRRNRLRSSLVVAEIALTFALLVGAGLLVKSFNHLQQVDPGFNAANLVTTDISLAGPKYSKADQVIAYYDESLERLSALPGVESVGAVNVLPLSGNNTSGSFRIEGRPEPAPGDRPNAGRRFVSLDYLSAMGTRLVAGRLFTEEDMTEQSVPVAIVNETMARRYWPGEDPLGKHLKRGSSNDPRIPWTTIVGVISDIKHRALDKEARPEMFEPMARQPSRSMFLVARINSDPEAAMSVIRSQLLGVDREQPPGVMKTMDQLIEQSTAPNRFAMLLLTVFAVIATILAAIGLYGVMAYSVSRRTHEIGIRRALGAGEGSVLAMIVRQGMTLSLLGVAAGLGCALALSRLMSSILFGVSPTDPATFAVVAALLVAVAMLATYVPARRAARVDPMTALRYE